MTHPNAETLYRLTASTWPPARIFTHGPWTLRDAGAGPGRVSSRVSAATADGPVTDADIAPAETAMRAMNQPPLFMIRAGDDALDALLDARGYAVMDPVNLYTAPVERIAAPVPRLSAIAGFPPTAIACEIWAEGGIGPNRIAIMDRADGPKTTLLGRRENRAAGTVYVAADGPLAMLHALEIRAPYRRMGLARELTQACANWAAAQGCTHLSLITTTANEAANTLYSSLGMEIVGHYHYRSHPEVS